MQASRFIILAIIAGCSGRHTHEMEAAISGDSLSKLEFPIRIDSGKRMVYKYFKMTPRGPQFFLDTIDTPEGFTFAELNPNVIYPISLTDEERIGAKALIAISLPGYFDETIIGYVDDDAQLAITIRDEQVRLNATGPLNFDASNLISDFKNGSIEVRVSSALSDTPTRMHRAGRGKLQLYELGRFIQDCEIFLVVRK
jgi:hypothetical protein